MARARKPVKKVPQEKALRQRGSKKGRAGTLKPRYRYTKSGDTVRVTKYAKCRRTKRRVDKVTVVLPCGSKKVTPALKQKLDEKFSVAEWNKCANTEGCRVVFFDAKTPVMRGRSKTAKMRAKGVCRRTKGPKKGLFVSKTARGTCPRGSAPVRKRKKSKRSRR